MKCAGWRIEPGATHGDNQCMDILPQQAPARDARRRVPFGGAVVAVVVLVASLLVLLGGSGGSVADAATVVRAAGARAAQAGSASVDLQMKMAVAGHDITATGGGAFDFRRRTGQLSLDMPGFGEMQEVVTSKALYLRMPDALTARMGTAKPWMEMRWAALNSPGIDLSKMMSSNPSADPTSMLKTLSDATAVHRDGSATVRGVHTTHYSGSATMLDLARAEGMNGVDPTQLPSSVANAKIRFDVWLDARGLTRRMSMHMAMGDVGTMTMTMELYDFGKPVTVIPPPPSIVTDLSTLLANGG